MGALEQIGGDATDLTRRQDLVEDKLDDLSSEESRRVADLRSMEERLPRSKRTLRPAESDRPADRRVFGQRLARSPDASADSRFGTRSGEALRQRDFLRRIHDETRHRRRLRGMALSPASLDLVRVEKKYRKCSKPASRPS